MKKRATAEIAEGDTLENIKKVAIVAMFSDDVLMDQLVLKGGNAMDLIHQVNSRASIDLDFSMTDDLDFDTVYPKVQRALHKTFEIDGYLAFDIKMSARPRHSADDDLAQFWGGYLIEFKLISLERADAIGQDIDTMRQQAIRLGKGTKFTIDLSRYEYTD
ncbi:MAG: hypothetical protein COB41_05750, partial [Proteobacteria bacterium]